MNHSTCQHKDIVCIGSEETQRRRFVCAHCDTPMKQRVHVDEDYEFVPMLDQNRELESWQEHYARRASRMGSDFLDHDHSMDH